MKKNRTNSRRNTLRPTVVYVGLAICVLSSASAIATVWRWTIDKNPPVLMELRINEVRVNLPEFPTTRVDHRASVVRRSSWVSMEGFGQYRKIAPHLGGNQDGKITEKDAIFNRLLLWVDSNADGVSHRSEVFPISAFEIRRIDAMPKAVAENERVDAAGNVIPYWSWVKTRSTDLPPKLKMAGIFFRVIE